MSLIYSSESKEDLLKDSCATAIAQGSYSQRVSPPSTAEKNSDIWIRSFLINSQKNARQWSVDEEALKTNVFTILHAPLVLAQDAQGRADHPEWIASASLAENLSYQSKYKIGEIQRIHFWPDNNSYYVDSKITDETAKAYIKQFSNGKVPISVSPQIVFDSRTEPKNGPYKNFHFTHLAIVSRGAYPDAKVIGVCSGSSTTCKDKLPKSYIDNNNTAVASASVSTSASASYPRFIRNMPGWEIFYKTPTSVPIRGKKPHHLA